MNGIRITSIRLGLRAFAVSSRATAQRVCWSLGLELRSSVTAPA
jgi:hypothetical protein